MHCSDLHNHLDALLDGSLTAEITVEVHAHLADCGSCHVVVRTCRETVRVYRDESPPEVHANLHARVLDAVRKRLP